MADEFQGPPAVNFYGMLSGLGDTIQNSAKLQREQSLRDSFKDGLPKGPDGSIDFGATGNILSQHGADLGTILTVAKLAEEQRKNQQALKASSDFRTSLGGLFGGTPPSPATTAPTSGAPPTALPTAAPVAPPGAPVQPTSKVWGDKEAEDAGLYPPKDPPTASFGQSLGRKPPPLPVGLQPQPQPAATPQAGSPLTAQPQQAQPPAADATAPAAPAGFQGIGVQHIPALASAMANPYLPSGDRDLAGQLLKRALDDAKEPDKIRTLTALKEQSGYPGTILQLEMEMRKASQTNVNVSQTGEKAQSQKVGAALGDVQAEDIKAGSHAGVKLRQLATLDDANKSGGDDISNGPFAELALKGKQGLNEIAGEDLTNAAPAEVIKKVGFGLATNMVKAISSRPSQMEFMKGLENVPNLMMSKTGRIAMTSIMTQEARAEQDLGKLAARHKDVEGGPVWQEVKDNYYDQHPLISPFTGKPFTPNDVQMIAKSVPQSDAGTPASPQQQPPGGGGNVSRQGVPWSIVQ